MDYSSLLWLLLLKLTAIIFQVIPGSLAQGWSVSHTPSRLCALHNSSVALPCKYTYPSNQTVTSSAWHYKRSKGMAFERQIAYSLSDGSNCSLTLDRVTQADAGVYQFSFRTRDSTKDLKNEDGVTLEITDLHVDMEPQMDMVLEGDWVMLICGSCIPSLTVPTYTWYKDGHQFKQTRGDYHLELTDIKVEDEGSYQCSITGHEGRRSSAVNFTVIYPPKNVSVSISPSGEIVEGSSMTLTCSSDANPPVEIYTWFKNMTSVEKGRTYTISNISSEDSGEYRCRSSNEVGHQDSSSVTLNVLYPPKKVSVSISPSGEIVEDSSVTLTCSSDANPPVEIYTWFNESSAVGSGQSYRALQSGQYYCEAQNKHGSERSATVSVTLHVSGHPIIVYVSLGVGLFGLAALLSALFCLSRSRRQRKQKEEHDSQNAGPSAKDDTYAALDRAGQTSNDVYHTLTIFRSTPPADTHTSSDYEAVAEKCNTFHSNAATNENVYS
ncbi:sialoadhesin-like isoform X1 [Clarias gariepinus]|uniref:sialoadhesin-like isoform X1 n=1 Tax=Clarias gariepinus TaxID=13013 RepID=UPI00234CBD1F|nr:sialoadhesin-like isoform X1 [Clarias gariepinus]